MQLQKSLETLESRRDKITLKLWEWTKKIDLYYKTCNPTAEDTTLTHAEKLMNKSFIQSFWNPWQSENRWAGKEDSGI